MLDRVLVYVRSVIAGKTKGDPAIGKYLLETFSTSTEGLDHGSFATSLQVSHDIIFLLLKDYLRIVGHAYGLLSRKPHQITSRGIVQVATRYFLIDHLLLCNTHFRCCPCIAVFWYQKVNRIPSSSPACHLLERVRKMVGFMTSIDQRHTRNNMNKKI